MAIVTKKVWPPYFAEILRGEKTFELRNTDFSVEPGDTLRLREWDPETKDYTGREVKKTVGYVGRWTLEDLQKFYPDGDIERDGFQVISLR
jgi:hypothetical protein